MNGWLGISSPLLEFLVDLAHGPRVQFDSARPRRSFSWGMTRGLGLFVGFLPRSPNACSAVQSVLLGSPRTGAVASELVGFWWWAIFWHRFLDGLGGMLRDIWEWESRLEAYGD